jgi:4-azaleucine resistance transporter AzlC
MQRENDSAAAPPSWADMREGFRRILPVTLYVVPMGLAFGAAAVAKGLPALIALVMSAFVFAGSSQFAALDLWSAGGLAVVPILAVTFAVNARHILLGASLAPWLNRLPLGRRLATAALLSDANWALAMEAAGPTKGAKPGRIGDLLVGSGAALWITWAIGTILGVALGADPAFLSELGLDLLVVTFFAAVLASLWRSVREDLLPWLAAAVVSVAAAWLLPPGWYVMAGALAGGLVGALRHGR